MSATWEIREGDCVEAMAAMEPWSVDAIVTDPPYGLEFMGKDWDRLGDGFRRAANAADVGRDDPFGRTSRTSPEYRAGRAAQEWHERWAVEALRVLKPGGHLLAFGGTRTYHRLASALEDAGFDIRDEVMWLYGSGFPKSLNLGDGRGTALKPAHEPVVVARKPLVGTVAANVSEHGTGALNIDACRLAPGDGGVRDGEASAERRYTERGGTNLAATPGPRGGDRTGRWPANVVLSHTPECVQIGTKRVKPVGATARTEEHGMGQMLNNGGKGKAHPGFRDAEGLETVEAWECAENCPVRMLDEQSGVLTSGSGPLRRNADKFRNTYGEFKGTDEVLPPGDSGGASRFFYCAKADRAERNVGLDGFAERDASERINITRGRQMTDLRMDRPQERRPAANLHPTVKPVEVMRWLVRLVTPPGGLVLDPFAGSGTTGIAAMREGFSFLGLERESTYCEIARARIRGDAPLLNTPAEVAA